MENGDNLLRKIFSILSITAVVGGAIVFLIYMVALIIGGKNGANLALLNRNYIMPFFIALASISLILGLIDTYIYGNHSLSINDE